MHLHVVDGNLKHRDVTINNWGVSGTPSGAQRRQGPHPEGPSIRTQKTAIRKETRWGTWSVGSIVLFHIFPSSPPPSPSFEFHPLSLLPSAHGFPDLLPIPPVLLTPFPRARARSNGQTKMIQPKCQRIWTVGDEKPPHPSGHWRVLYEELLPSFTLFLRVKDL